MKKKAPLKKVALIEKFNSFADYWSPYIVGEMNGQMVKIAKFKGDFIMHNHPNEDEMFLVVKGTLFIRFESETLTIDQGEFVIVPRGVNHQPFAPEEVHVLLFEPSSTLNTGNQISPLTKRDLVTL